MRSRPTGIPVVFVTAKDLNRDDLRQLEEFGDPVVRKDATDDQGLLKTVGSLLKGVARPPRPETNRTS